MNLRYLLLFTAFAAAPLSAGAAPSPNLLTDNTGFETPGGFGGGHGVTRAVPGWEIDYWAYDGFGVTDGGAAEGKRFLNLNHGGRITTAEADRVSVQPGKTYELRFTARKPSDGDLGSYSGWLPSILFFDGSDKLIKNAKTLPVQMDISTEWQTFTHRATAPAGAVKAAVQVIFSRGTWPHEDARTGQIDDVRLTLVPETRDTVVFRRAPRLLMPGRSATVKVRYTATAPRTLVLRLQRGAAAVLTQTASVPSGCGVQEWTIPLPKSLPPGSDYQWVARTTPAAKAVVQGAFVDERMSGSGEITPDNPNILYAGRWDRSDPKNPVCYWGGSQIITRFRGASIQAKVATGDDNEFLAILDGDADHMIAHIHPHGGLLAIASGLTDADHTLILMKNTETDKWATFQGFTLPAGRGLLRPEPLSPRRIEFYGDSITSGGQPDPLKDNPDRNSDGDYTGNFARTYAAFTARELGADWRPISKGGTGVGGSWVFNYTLLDYWDKLDFNTFDPSKARRTDFTAWQPQAVVITVGHNDRFRAPSREVWAKNYAALIQNLERVYPKAHFFCSNTAMSSDHSWWAAALVPLMKNDPKVHFLEFDPSQPHGGHPRLEDHRDMATGTVEWDSMADWIGETMGW